MSLVLVAISAAIQITSGYSLLHQNEAYWQRAYSLHASPEKYPYFEKRQPGQSEDDWKTANEMHQVATTFKGRPLSTTIIGALHDHLNFDIRTSYEILQFTLMFACGLSLFYFLRSLSFGPGASLAGMSIFLLSLPVFLAHVEPVYTWSDFWGYTFVPLCFGLTIRRKPFMGAVCFAIALLARETTLIFIPIWFLFMNELKVGKLQILLLGIMSTIPFLVFRFFVNKEAGFDPIFMMDYNFKTLARSRDSIFYALFSNGIIWLGLYPALKRANPDFPYFKVMRLAVFWTVTCILVLTVVLARMRESRLYMPAAVFLIPMLLIQLKSLSPQLYRVWNKGPWSRVIWSIGVLLLIVLSRKFAELIFPQFEYYTLTTATQTYAGIHIAGAILFVSLVFSTKNKQRTKSTK